MELLHREFEIRSTDLEAREVTGIAVPYNEVTQIGRMKEKFMPNSINVTKMPKLFYNHDEPIGIIRSMDDAEDGLHITAKISNTAKGNDAWTLVKDGVVRSFFCRIYSKRTDFRWGCSDKNKGGLKRSQPCRTTCL